MPAAFDVFKSPLLLSRREVELEQLLWNSEVSGAKLDIEGTATSYFDGSWSTSNEL